MCCPSLLLKLLFGCCLSCEGPHGCGALQPVEYDAAEREGADPVCCESGPLARLALPPAAAVPCGPGALPEARTQR